MHSRQVKKYIVCFLGGSSIGKASEKFGIPKIRYLTKSTIDVQTKNLVE